jgi:hypothetical protein
MTKLSPYFPSDKLDVIQRMQLEWFYTRYTEEYYSDYLFGHFMMAAYAAIPAYLTPDLLYKIWQNFGEYQWGEETKFIHPIAVSDVLLAPFCKEVSYELYQMEENTRLSFLKWMNSGDTLWTNRKPYKLSQIAEFIEAYHDKPNDTVVREGAGYRDEQLMEVKVYQDPEEVANMYLQKLHDAREQKQESEILSLINALNKATEKEEYTQYNKDKNTFTNLFKKGELDLWKHAIQKNNNTFANLLATTNPNGSDGSHLLFTREEYSYNIQVNTTETKLVTQLDALVKSRNIALVIGCSEEEIANCNFFSQTLEKINRGEKWETRLFTRPSNELNLISELNIALQPVTAGDNLIIYISCPVITRDESGNWLINFFGSNIAEREFANAFSSVSAASFTLVLECRHPVTSGWLDTNKPGYAIFAATSYEHNERPGKKERDTISPFTRRLCDILSNTLGNISNRQLFVNTVSPAGSVGDNPALISNRKTYSMQFASGDLLRNRIHHNLRLCGYLDDSESMEWDTNAETALQKLATELKIEPVLADMDAALDKKLQANYTEQKPILLFVLSDKERALPAITTEMQSFKAALKNSKLDEYNDIKIIQNKPLKEVNDFIKKVLTRNRIQFFYYSGLEIDGNPSFSDGVIDLQRWADWMGYQERMEMVMLNTCRSAVLARQLTQIGVGMSIGHYEDFLDSYGGEFGSELLRIIPAKGNLSELQMEGI